MARKLISFLGINPYHEGIYELDGADGYRTCFVQTALARIIPGLDLVTVLVTEEAQKRNWEGDAGLWQTAQKHCPQIPFVLKQTKEGKTIKEIWEIFDDIRGLIDEKDEVFLDVTHSFRSLPIINLACVQYLKALKKVRVSRIYYGAWDARKPLKNPQEYQEPPHVPVFDLTPFLELMDWSRAVHEFEKHGQVQSLMDLVHKEVLPRRKSSKGQDQEAKLLEMLVGLLENTQQNIATCRGQQIYTQEPWHKASELLKGLQAVPSTIAAFYPLLDMIQAKLEQLRGPEIKLDERVLRGFGAVSWCLEHGLVQQAYTLLQENIITWFCIEVGNDYQQRSNRELVTQALSLASRDIPAAKWHGQAAKNPEKIKEIQKLFSKDFLKLYNKLYQNRNDINHAGTVKCFQANKLIKDVGGLYQKVIEDLSRHAG